MNFYIIILLICGLSISSLAWDTEELEIFDLVEAINTNFYNFMSLSQNATTTDVKRAFRTLSIQLHPDKNPSEDANVQFRNLVSIYEVLKDPGKRVKYDKVLRDGLPNWKSALYYYRRMRKIGLYEGAAIVFVIITIGQYIFSWAAYLEIKYTAEALFRSKQKKMNKKNKTVGVDTILHEIPKPSLKNTLPIQIPVFLWNLPKMVFQAVLKAKEINEIAAEKRRKELEEAKRLEEFEKKAEELARLRKEKRENLRKRRQNAKAPEKTEEELKGYSTIQLKELNDDDAVRPVEHKDTPSGGFWTDEDLAELIRLVKKYPSGSGNRWQTIAENLHRTVQEVTFMAAKMKENGYRLLEQKNSTVDYGITDSNKMNKKEEMKRRKMEKSLIIAESSWNQEQQKALEAAIVKYKKSTSGDRWQKIANCVPQKSKDECLIRYKFLCELVKAQMKSNQTANIDNTQDKITIPESEVNTSSADKPDNECIESENLDDKQNEDPSTYINNADGEESNELARKSDQKLSKRKERRKAKMHCDEHSD